MASDPDPDPAKLVVDPPLALPKVASFAVMVVVPAVVAGALNLALLISGGSNLVSSAFGAVVMAVVMACWMNRRRNKKLAENAEIAAAIARFGRPAAPSGGWANPNTKQRFERWFDRNRVYRRR